MTDVRPVRAMRARLVALWLTLMLAISVATARASGTTWLVDRPGDDATDGDLGAHRGTLRFTLAHATSGDLVNIGDVGADKIFVSDTLTVPAGVAVGGRRDQSDCGSYKTPLAVIEESPPYSLDTIVRLEAGATLRNIDIGGGKISVRVLGANVEVCGVGLGVEYDGDGNANPAPPRSLALSIDGAHTAIRRNRINGDIAVGMHGSDSRIGDAIGGDGDMNDGLYDAAVTVGDQNGVPQRVTIRDPLPRALHGLVGSGVAGGEDDPTHANNWAQTPTIISAYTDDNFATVQVRGIANPLSLVDIYLDNQLNIARQPPVMADATGVFTFGGELPPTPPDVRVFAVSTLNDGAHPNRVGSSSEWSEEVLVSAPSVTPIQLDPAALTFTAILTDSAPPAQHLAVTVPSSKPHLAWQTAVSTANGLNWLKATPVSAGGNGTVSVTVDQSDLQPGIYHGTVTVLDSNNPADRATTAITLLALSAEPLLGATGGVVDLSGPPAGPARPGDALRFTASITNFGAVEVTNIGSANLLIPPGYTVVAGSGSISGGSGFVATDRGFSGGALAPGASVTYTLDVNVPSTAQSGMAVFSVEVYADRVVSIPVVGRMRIGLASPVPQPVAWLPIVVR